jgi:tetratricopeptide (TPR) repeat protein
VETFSTFQMTQSQPSPLLEEASALLDLGLHDEAVRLIDTRLGDWSDREAHAAALEVFTRIGRYARAGVSADVLIDAGNCTREELFRISLAYNFSGRLQEAYDIERAIQPTCNDTSLVRLYGLACKSTRLGRRQEALGYLLACFHYKNIENWDAFRKIFIDSELAHFWPSVPSLEISLRDAMRHCNLPFDEILAHNESVFPLRCLDHMDLFSMPKKFRALLNGAHSTCFEVSAVAESQNPALYAEFVEWQRALVAPRLEIFKQLRDRIRGMVVARQLDFAAFQAERGRVGCARNHIVCHLLHSPGASINDIPDVPALRPLVQEFRSQIEECPESFHYLISWECKSDPEGFIRDILPEMPQANRESGYASLALGCMHYRLGNTAAAIEHWSECARKWPLDDAPVMNATMILSGEQRWDEASRFIDRLPGECRKSALWQKACHAIRERRTFSICNKTHATPEIPTPTFGRLHSGADEEFLVGVNLLVGVC